MIWLFLIISERFGYVLTFTPAKISDEKRVRIPEPKEKIYLPAALKLRINSYKRRKRKRHINTQTHRLNSWIHRYVYNNKINK